VTAAFVDSNVLVPYLSGDDPDRMAMARGILETNEPRVLSVVVLLETAWVLRRVYGYETEAVAATLIDLLARTNIEVAELPTGLVQAMIGRWRDHRIGSVGDALIAASMIHAGATTIHSLDRRFPRDLGWEVADG